MNVTSCQIWRSQEKVCHLAPATLEPVSPSSTAFGIKSFSKFDRQQLCSPLTYRPHIYSINRSKPFKKVCQISRLCCLLLGPLWLIKIPLVYFINGKKGGLDCSPLNELHHIKSHYFSQLFIMDPPNISNQSHAFPPLILGVSSFTSFYHKNIIWCVLVFCS